MTTPVTIDRAMTLKTTRFEPALELGIEDDDTIVSIEDLNRVHLYLGVPSGSGTRGEMQFDQSRRAVRQALNEAIRIARTIDTVNGVSAPLAEHDAIFECIRAFASRYGALWGVPAIVGVLPRDMKARKIDGSMRQWYRELLTLLDVHELIPVASGKREDRALRGRVHDVEDGKVTVFISRASELFYLATRGQKIKVQLPWEPQPQLVESWQLAHGRSPALAWVILTTICKHRLDGRINIGLHPSERNSLAITPDGIGPTLFARLWLDALHRETNLTLVRMCQRPGCENPIPECARADAQYCGNTCQRTDRRRLVRLQSAGV